MKHQEELIPDIVFVHHLLLEQELTVGRHLMFFHMDVLQIFKHLARKILLLLNAIVTPTMVLTTLEIVYVQIVLQVQSHQLTVGLLVDLHYLQDVLDLIPQLSQLMMLVDVTMHQDILQISTMQMENAYVMQHHQEEVQMIAGGLVL